MCVCACVCVRVCVCHYPLCVCVCVCVYFDLIYWNHLQCSISMVENSSSAFASMRYHSVEVISSDEDLKSVDEPTVTDNDKMEGLECVLEM